jgi:hypothetical protein
VRARLYTYEVPYRRCVKASGLTYPIAICTVCMRVVEPSAKEYSKTGAHGTWYYEHEHPLAFIMIVQSNSGKREVAMTPGVPRPLREIVRVLWIYRASSAEEVEEAVAKWLEARARGEKI